MIITMGLSAVGNFYLKSRAVTILFFVLILASFLFIKIMMNYFTRKVLIELDNDKISFKIFKLKEDVEETFFDYSFFDIKSYNIQFPTSRFACLILNSNSGNKKEFSFLTKNRDKLQIDTNNLIEVVHKNFKHFNLEHQQVKTIEFEPSFYASKKGLYTIGFLVFLLVITIGLVIKLDKNLPATFVGSLLLIGQLLTRRSTDLSFYHRMKSD